MIRKVLLVLLLVPILGFNLKLQQKSEDANCLKLTPLSEQLLNMFIADSMNSKRLNPRVCSLVLSFGDNSDSDVDLWILDADLLNSCVDHFYLTKYEGFYLFYRGEINAKYISGIRGTQQLRCSICDSLIKSKGNPIVFKEYDGSIYKVYKETNERNKKIVKIRGG